MILPLGAFNAILEDGGKEFARLQLEGSPHPAVIFIAGKCFTFYRRKHFTDFHYKCVAALIVQANPKPPPLSLIRGIN